ncbi:MAG: hypothetical protein IIX01_05385, partial [Clostridia bacterium]|nr:hypothetical protein [Clostridia bacterium]
TNLYLLFINPQTLIRETEIVLRLTCHCPECEGKMTEYRTTLNELYELGNKSGETQDHLTKIAFGDFYDVGDGYVMEGLYVSYGQYDELFNCSLIEMILKERYEQGQTIDGMVFGLYTKKRTVSTHKIIVKGFDKDIVHYVVEGGYFNWNFLFESVPDGYVLKALYENEQCTSGEHSAFTDGGSWEVLGDETVYAKFVQDERIEVTVHFGYLTRAKLDGSYYQQGQAESKRSESYTFKMFADEKLSYYLQSLSVDGYPSNNSVITGYYYDEEFTRPVGQNDLPTDGMEVYAYLGELVEITLHYVSGFEDTRMEFKGRVLSEVINEYEVQNQRTEEYVSVMKFYSDEERTKEIFSVIEGDIYVGYKEVPHITIVCPDGCNLLAEEHRIKAENGQIGWAIENHRSKTLAGHDNPIRFYYDEAFTRPVKPDDFVTDSVTIYGKEEYERRSYTVHCGCLTHGNSGIQLDACDEEDAVDYVKLVCDFGRPVFHFSFYSNEERTQGFSFYGSNEETGINEVWLQKFTLVYVYAEGSQARADGKMLVDTIFDVLEFFYIEKTGDGLSYELKGSYEKHWVMYLDNTFTVARALPYEYELTAGEKFYFREETYNRYENLITLKADGFEDYSFYAGTGISGATSVERRAFAGKRIEGLYLDSALTKPVVVGKDIDSGIRANWDVVLYARVVDMPTMIIYSDASTGDTNDYYTFEIYSDEPYRHFLWNVLQNDYYYSQWIDGKVLEVCKNEDGTEPIDLSDLAEAGEYYFRYNAYSKNNVKITLSGVEYPEEQYVYLADCIKIGYENYFYLTKGKTFADVEKIMERMALGVVAENGQSFSLGMQENGTHGLGGGIKIRYYSDSAMTNEITANTVLNADTTIYVKLDFTNAEKVVVHLENKGTIVFYTGDHSYFQLSEFFRNCVYNTSISPDMYERYPKLFAYGAIKAVYTDSAMTELYDYGNMNATDLYCRLAPIYTIRILFADGKVYQKQFVTAELSLRDVFGSGIAGSCEQRYGYTSVLAYDKEGKNLVDEETERVTGSKDYYIVYVRQEGYVSVKLVCSCGTSHKDCDVWLWGMSFANGEQMRMIGNADEFCVTEGYNIQAILLELSYRLHGNIEYYSDSAMTKKLTDFTVNSDTVVYVKVVVVIA